LRSVESRFKASSPGTKFSKLHVNRKKGGYSGMFLPSQLQREPKMRIVVQADLGKKERLCLKNKQSKKDWGMV
jgi:hypothetical protein